MSSTENLMLKVALVAGQPEEEMLTTQNALYNFLTILVGRGTIILKFWEIGVYSITHGEG